MNEMEFCMECRITHWIITINAEKKLLLSNSSKTKYFKHI